MDRFPGFVIDSLLKHPGVKDCKTRRVIHQFKFGAALVWTR